MHAIHDERNQVRLCSLYSIQNINTICMSLTLVWLYLAVEL